MKWIALILLWSAPAFAASYHVSTNGSDVADGLSWPNAWRTLAKAATVATSGDTVEAGAGDFDEYLQFTGANVRWFSNSNATWRAFRVSSVSNTLSGVTLSKACDAEMRTWGAAVYIDSGAHFTTITNCKVIDQPWLEITNWSFNPSGANTNKIVGTGIDFEAAGFEVGGSFWVNGVSYATGTRGYQFRFANQQRAVRPTNVTTTTLTFSNDVLVAETNLSVWAVIGAGNTPDFAGIKFVPSGGTGATNCVVTSCLFSNWIGQPVVMRGNGNVITNCEFTAIYGNSFITFSGSRLTIISNYLHDCPLPAYYSSSTEEADHTGSFYDYYVRTIIQGNGDTDNTNIVIQGNWMQDVDGGGVSIQHSLASDPGDIQDFKLIGNVFIGVAGPTDGGQNIMSIQSNLFLRCVFPFPESTPLGIGGGDTPALYTNSNLIHTHNLYAANGNHKDHDNEGYPSFTRQTGITSFSNYVCGSEITQWNPMSSWGATNGINGGNPMFVNEFNPLGPDGRPFTADDGVRLHPLSPAIGIGPIGVTTSNFLAYFTVTASNANTLDGTNFNNGWHTNLYTFQRSSWDRLWDYGDGVPVPRTVGFTATNSISGTWSTNDWVGCRDFVWNFGDNSRPVWTRWPDVSHTFLRTGQVTVTLTITNSATNVTTHSRNYYILPIDTAVFTNEIIYVSTNGSDANSGLTEALSKLHITNGMKRLGPGDYLAVLSNTNEICDDDITSATSTLTNGTALLPITIVSYSTNDISGGRQEVSWWTWEGFGISGTLQTNMLASQSFFEIKAGQVNGITFRNCYWNANFLTNVSAIAQSASGGLGGTNHSVINCVFDKVGGIVGVVHFAGCTNIVMEDCIDLYSSREADVLKVYGSNVRWTGQYSFLFGYTNNSHSDWMSFGLDSTIASDNIVVENFWAESVFGTETSPANNGYGDQWLQATNITVRNGVFINFFNGMNPLGFNGAKVYNCLFYRSPWTNSTTIIQGINKSAISNDFRNNIFFENYNHGTDSSRGWYANGAGDTNVIGLIANYNYVCGTNFSAKDTAPPDDAFSWAITGQESNGINGGDPKFVNSAIYDFRLLTNSPLLNAGASVVTTDFWGRDRVGAVDIGPFEGTAEAQAAPATRGPMLRGGMFIRGKIDLR